MPNRAPTIALALLVATLSLFTAVHAQEGGAPAEAVLDPELAARQLESARTALAAVPADAAEDSAEGERRAALRRRVTLLEEYLALAAEAVRIEQTREGLDARLADARASLDELAAQPEPEAPESITDEGFEALESEVAAQRERVTSLRAAAAEATRRVEEELPRIEESLATRADEAERRAALVAQRLPGAADEAARATLELRLENARLDRDVAREARAVRAEEARLLAEQEPVADAEIDLAQTRLERMERRLALAAEVLAADLARERSAAEAELASKERAAEEATEPAARFIAEREARLARSRKNTNDAQASLLALGNELTEQERRLATERDELIALRELISRPGTSGMAEDRIRVTLQQAKLRRDLLERAMRSGLGGSMNEYRSRRFIIDDTLFGLAERFEAERAAVIESLAASERAVFERRTDELLTELRAALRGEKAALTELIALGQQVQKLYLERLEVLGNLERFIRSRAFWLRDGRPLGPAVLAPLPTEIGRFGQWLEALWSAETWSQPGRAGATGLLYALGLLLLVPVALLWLRQRLRAATRRVNDRVLAEGRKTALLLLAMLTGVLSAAVLPAYLLIAAGSLGAVNLPPAVGPVLVTLLEHLGYFLFAWFLARSFFGGRSTAEVLFGMPHQAANAFFGAIRWVLLAYGVFLIPWIVLSAPPFEFVALPRIAYVAFLVMTAYGVARLVRRGSPFIEHRLARIGEGFFHAHWQTIGNVIAGIAVAIVLLDAAGFRYAARSIGTSFAWTLLTVLVLPLVYDLVVGAVRQVSGRLRPRSATGFGTEDEDTAQDALLTGEHVVGFVRLVTIVVGVVLVAGFWGLDERALATLDELQIYTVRGVGDEEEFVTAADVARALLFLVGTFWLLRALPGVYEFALFPRLRLDEGLKYAILTMSRYTVFVLGFFLTLAEIHLDLGRLGWLMAAIGVGLGFGLQEIVSNFVSGVILLIERPVRPGDVVTVSGITGTVQRINIRATTIMNFDRQEVMLPNRSLITSEVTNWTRGDTMNRVVIPIGVAYGTDVDEMTELLGEIARADPDVLTDPGPVVFFMAHGESSLDFEIRLYVPSPSEMLRVRDRINKAINRELARRGIEIPFPQRDLHIRSGLPEFGGHST